MAKNRNRPSKPNPPNPPNPPNNNSLQAKVISLEKELKEAKINAELYQLQYEDEKERADNATEEAKKSIPEDEKKRLISERQSEIDLDMEKIQQDYLDNKQKLETTIELLEKNKADIEQKQSESENKAKEKADKIIARAKDDAIEQKNKLVSEGNDEKNAIIAKAFAEKEAILHEAKEKAIQCNNIAFSDKEEELSEKERYLEKRECELKEKNRELTLGTEILKDESENLKCREEYLDKRIDELDERWDMCSPQELERLTNELNKVSELYKKEYEERSELEIQIQDLQKKIETDGKADSADVLKINTKLETVNKELRQKLLNYPDEFEMEHLKEVSKREREKGILISELEKELNEKNIEISQFRIKDRKLINLTKENDTLEVLNTHLGDKFDELNQKLSKSENEHFPALKQMWDEKDGIKKIEPKVPDNFDLIQLVQHVRNYAARKEGLYYSEDTIRTFVAGLAASRLFILEGLSGTGKTSLPRIFGKAVNAQPNTLVPVQSNWRDRSELLGYDNDFHKRFTETEFTKLLFSASIPNNRERLFFITLDEMNLSTVEYYFADFLSVMEKPDVKDWFVELTPNKPSNVSDGYLKDGHRLEIPSNVWFVGTVNRDESTKDITDKVYDRAQIIEFNEKECKFNPANIENISLTKEILTKLLDNAKSKKYENKYQDTLELLDSEIKDIFKTTFGYRIKKQMDIFVSVYAESGGRWEDAFDTQFAVKVVKKLAKNIDGETTKGLIKFKDSIKELKGNDMPKSIAVIDKRVE